MARRIIWVMILLLGGLAYADAAVIAVMFDDSGSMGGKIQLPAFGAQLLVSSLDGRNGQDRLLTARMSDNATSFATRQQDIASIARQTELIGQIASKWPVAARGTPYAQVSMLLHQIVSLQRPGEEAYFIIFTDGEFNEPLPPIDAALADYGSIKAQLKGPLRVDYVVIGPNDASDEHPGKTVGQVVDDQGLRAGLLQTFNRDPADGRHDVFNALDLTETIKTILARTAAADRPQLERFFSRRANEIHISSPLAIHRIVTVASAPEGVSLERPNPARLSPKETYALRSEMKQKDTRGAWRNDRLLGEATHMLFDPPLPAGDHVLVFDGPVDKTLVLPHTEAKLQLSFVEPDGTPLLPGPDGVVTLGEGTTVRLAVDVLDDVGSRLDKVPASRLGGAGAFTLHDERHGKDDALDVAVDPKADRAFAPFPTANVAEGRVSGTMRVSGLDTFSEPLRYRIVAIDTALSIRVVPGEACTGCGPDEIGKTLHVGDANGQVATIEVSLSTPIAGRLNLHLIGEDDMVAFGDAAAKDGTLSLDVGPGAHQTITVPLRLALPADDVILKPKTRYAFSIDAQAAGPLKGNARRAGMLVLAAPRPSLVAVGNSQDPSGAKALRLDLDAIETGDAFAAFEFKDVIGQPAAGSLDVTSDKWFLRYRPEFSGNRLVVKPESSWFCACFLFFDQGSRDIRLQWSDASGLQKASSHVQVEVAIPLLWQAVTACGKLVLLVLLLLYLLRGAFVASRTRIFPHGSGMDFTYLREDPRFIAFPSGVPSKIKAFLLPFGNTHQRARVQGLHLQAARGGAHVLFEGSDASFRFENLGQTMGTMKEERPVQTFYFMVWNEKAESKAAGRCLLQLLKKAADRYGSRG